MRSYPTSTELLADRALIRGIRRAFEQSDVGGSNPIEQCGFIVRDLDTGIIDIDRLPARRNDSFTYPICTDGMYNGRQIVGTFHTHPNTGPEWSQEPSNQDMRLSTDYPETMGPHQFVIARERVYHIGNDGVLTDVGTTSNVLRLGNTGK